MSAEQYTPTTEDVRTRYFSGSGRILPALGEFDRWLASRDAQVRAEALCGTRVEYAVAREEHPSVPVHKRRDLESAEAFVLNPPLGEKRHGWLIISRLVLTDPWKPTNQQDRSGSLTASTEALAHIDTALIRLSPYASHRLALIDARAEIVRQAAEIEKLNHRLGEIVGRINESDDGAEPPSLRDIYLIANGRENEL